MVWDHEFAAPGVNGDVRALAFTDTRVIVAGDFTYAGSAPVDGLAVYDTDSQIWSRLDVESPNGVVNSLAVSDEGLLYVGGQFTEVAGITANNVAAYDVSTRQWHALGAGIASAENDTGVETLEIDESGNLWVGGQFERAGDITVRNLAYWTGEAWGSVGDIGGGNSRVADISAHREDVCFVGRFETAGGANSINFACWNRVSESWTRFSAFDRISYQNAVSIDDDGIYVAGGFRNVIQPDGAVLEANNLAYWRHQTEAWEALHDGLPLLAALAPGADGATFVAAAGGERFLFRHSGTGWTSIDTSPVDHPMVYVSTIAYHDGSLYVGFGGIYIPDQVGPLGFLYASEGVSEGQQEWSVLGSEEGGIDGPLMSIVGSASGGVYVGGAFAFAGTSPARNVARWSSNSWVPLGQGTNGPVVDMLALPGPGEGLLVGGRFSEVYNADGNPLLVDNVALWSATQERWYRYGGYDGTVRTIALGPDGDVYLAGGASGKEATLCKYGTDAPIEEPCESVHPGHDLTTIHTIAHDYEGRLVLGGVYMDDEANGYGRVVRLDGDYDTWSILGEWFLRPVQTVLIDRVGAGGIYAGLGSGGTKYWNGMTWSDLEAGHSETIRAITMLPNNSGFLVAGTSVRAFTGVDTWIDIFHPESYISRIESVAVVDDMIWIGGLFQTRSGVPASAVIRGRFHVDLSSVSAGPDTSDMSLIVFPNPASTRVTASFSTPRYGFVRVVIVDMLGREVLVVSDGVREAGAYDEHIFVNGLPAGLYGISVSVNGVRTTSLITIIH